MKTLKGRIDAKLCRQFPLRTMRERRQLRYTAEIGKLKWIMEPTCTIQSKLDNTYLLTSKLNKYQESSVAPLFE